MVGLESPEVTQGVAGPAGPHRVLIVGGGICGLLTGMLLADDGHTVTVLERDPTPIPDLASDAWSDWERQSVRQFRMGHFFLPRFRTELMASLPRVAEAIVANGALVTNPIREIPEAFTGGFQPEDDRYEAITGRRPVIEAVIASCAEQTEGLTIRRGVVVSGLLTAPRPAETEAGPKAAPVHITGVETEQGEQLAADLVVDTSGRNSGLPRLLVGAGAPPPAEEADDSGFVYYGRVFRSEDGSLPATFGGGLQHYGSIATLTLAADNGTWQIAFVASGRDSAMRKVRDEEAFEAVWRSYPLVAHWLDGEPLSDIEMMANLQDRIRHFTIDDQPVATGLAAVGDSWACTNPSVGRGASIGLIHAVALRDHLRAETLDDPVAWSRSWSRRTSETVEPFYRETVSNDRHRLAQIEAAIEGQPYETDDRAFRFVEALPAASVADPEALRAFLDAFFMVTTLAEVMRDTELVDRVITLAASAEAAPGLNRNELEELLAGAAL